MMSASLDKARQIETAFLSAVQGRLDAARHWLVGSTFRTGQDSERDRLREMMRARGLYDADLLDRLPNNRRSTLSGYKRRWYGFGRKQVGAITASVLSPLADALDSAGSDAPGGVLRPIGRGELAEHVDALTAKRVGSHVIGVCSPSGFTEEARGSGLARPGMTLVLIEPHASGGWTVTGVSGPELDRACALFDPEGESQKVQRVRQAVEARRATLLSDGLNASDLAGELGIGQELVEATLRQMAADDDRLHVTRGERASILYTTSTAVKETPSMSVIDFLKRILGREASPAEKIKALEQKQAEIDDKRRGLESDLDELGKREDKLRTEGIAATATSVKRRLASQLAQLRQEIGLQTGKVSILNKQSQILGRQIHNLEVAQTARTSDLPASEAMTEAAAAAETALEELDETYETVRTVSSAISDETMTEEEAAILAEFEAEAAKQAEAARTSPETTPETERAEEPEPERTPDQRQREADG